MDSWCYLIITVKKQVMRIPRYPQGAQYIDKGEVAPGVPRTYIIAMQRQEEQRAIMQLMTRLSVES
jgi:hypothetical protein